MANEMNGRPRIMNFASLTDRANAALEPYFETALLWLLSPQAWGQAIAIIGCYALAIFAARLAIPRLRRLLTFRPSTHSAILTAAAWALSALPLLTPLLAFVLLSIVEPILAGTLGSATVLAFGKRVFLFLAIRMFVKRLLKDGMLNLLGRLYLSPIGLLYALGLLGTVGGILANTEVPLGNLSFDLLWLYKFVGVGGLIFWAGGWSNSRSNTYLNDQDQMPQATRQLAVKGAEIAIYGIAFLLVMNIMSINLSALAVLGGAIGVGLGFGLQKIASNFISGVILLLEGQATVGDYVELNGGEAGTIVKMLSRAAILETYDGRWIVVPNEDFITTRVVNYSDSGSANRYEASFSVSYNTDINRVPALVEAAVANHPDVLDQPFPPDCELRALGDSGVEFSVEFWVNGIDDGKNKFTSDVLFIIWNVLKQNDIEIPYPQQVIHHKGLPSK
ncbi:MAG: mechanosensitive ion channel family protein [Planktomarina sp.]